MRPILAVISVQAALLTIVYYWCFRDSDKAEAAGWGGEDGKKELLAEEAGVADAAGEATPAGAATPLESATPAYIPEVEEEDNTQTYDEYLAAQAANKISIGSLPEARAANEGADDSQWKVSTVLGKKGETQDEWWVGSQVRSFSRLLTAARLTIIPSDFRLCCSSGCQGRQGQEGAGQKGLHPH